MLKKVDRHWWYGCCCGKYGKIPGSHLLSLEVPPIEDSHELFAAVADFPCQQDGDLSFRKGDLFLIWCPFYSYCCVPEHSISLFIHLFIPLHSMESNKAKETGYRICQYYVYMHAYKNHVSDLQ